MFFVKKKKQFEEQAMLDLSDRTDHRKWTQQHLDAADLRIPSIAPTPPQGEIENDCMDVNVRGPGVYNYHLRPFKHQAQTCHT